MLKCTRSKGSTEVSSRAHKKVPTGPDARKASMRLHKLRGAAARPSLERLICLIYLNVLSWKSLRKAFREQHTITARSHHDHRVAELDFLLPLLRYTRGPAPGQRPCVGRRRRQDRSCIVSLPTKLYAARSAFIAWTTEGEPTDRRRCVIGTA